MLQDIWINKIQIHYPIVNVITHDDSKTKNLTWIFLNSEDDQIHKFICSFFLLKTTRCIILDIFNFSLPTLSNDFMDFIMHDIILGFNSNLHNHKCNNVIFIILKHNAQTNY